MLKHLQQVRPDLKFSAPEKSPVKGLYYTSIENGPTIYVTQDGKHFFAGDLFEVSPQGFVNLSERKKEGARKVAMEKLSTDDLIVFGPQKPKAHVYVFTDVDCHYCRKLHQEVPRLTELGVEVRYLAYPRAGVGSASYNKIVSAWCAKDPQTALTTVKNGGKIEQNVCKDNPVDGQYALGTQLGVTGTPAIITQTGQLLPGYMPAERLAASIGLAVPQATAPK